MSVAPHIKYLLVVVTRAYAEEGSSDDEFVSEWGFRRQDTHVGPTFYRDVALLVLHGHRGADLAKVVASLVLPEPEVTSILHHSLDGGDLVSLQKALVGLFPKCSLQGPRAYHSEGGTAVSGLLRVLDEAIRSGEIPLAASGAMNAAATGRPLFAEKLHGLRSGLLRMRMLFEAAVVTPDLARDKKAPGARPVDHQFNTEARRVRDAASDVCDMTSGASRRWLRALKESRHREDVERSLNCLWMLASPPADVGDRWYEYHAEPTWTYRRLREAPVHDAIRVDFAVFGRAVDVLIGALETLPSECPPRVGNDIAPSGRTS